MDLKEFFKENNKLALAFSGGVDSSYLLYAGLKEGANINAYFVKTPFQPEFEVDDAKRLAEELGLKVNFINLDILSFEKVKANERDRCYYCKRAIFESIIEVAEKDGYKLVMDGSNASDSYDDRPGMRAIKELRVISPLREAGLTKSEIRKRSREAGLFTSEKSSYSCLATRVIGGQEIEEGTLKIIEKYENFLMSKGYKDFRIRVKGKEARIEVANNDMKKILMDREEIYKNLSKSFEKVFLDLGGR